jgi:hypothetical protein
MKSFTIDLDELVEPFTLYSTLICTLIMLNNTFDNIGRFYWDIYIERLYTGMNKRQYFIMKEDGICANETCIFVRLDTFQKIKEKIDVLMVLVQHFII